MKEKGKCYICKKDFILSKTWTRDNVTFMDNLEVLICDDCLNNIRE